MYFVCELVGLEYFNKKEELDRDRRREDFHSQLLCFIRLHFVQDKI